MICIKIVIPGTPVAKSRHRCGCMGNKPFAYDPKEVRNFMDSVAMQMKSQVNSEKRIRIAAATYLSITYTFLFPVPESENLATQNAKLWGLIPHSTKPDFDNLEKLYTDCATGILWSDDKIINQCLTKKRYDETPRVEMEIVVEKEFELTDKQRKALTLFSPSRLIEFLHDTSRFKEWPYDKIKAVVEENMGENKELFISSLATMLIEFSEKYSKEIAKLSKVRSG